MEPVKIIYLHSLQRSHVIIKISDANRDEFTANIYCWKKHDLSSYVPNGIINKRSRGRWIYNMVFLLTTNIWSCTFCELDNIIITRPWAKHGDLIQNNRRLCKSGTEYSVVHCPYCHVMYTNVHVYRLVYNLIENAHCCY